MAGGRKYYRQVHAADKNQPDIVAHLKRFGYSVAATSQVGDGFVDLVVGCAECNVLMEVKAPGKAEALRPKQKRFRDRWSGPTYVVTTAAQALRVMVAEQTARQPDAVERTQALLRAWAAADRWDDKQAVIEQAARRLAAKDANPCQARTDTLPLTMVEPHSGSGGRSSRTQPEQTRKQPAGGPAGATGSANS